MPEIRSGDDEELVFFAILFMLNIICDVIHDVTDKHNWFDCAGNRTVSDTTGFSYCSEFVHLL